MVKIKRFGVKAGDRAQWIRALVALADDRDSGSILITKSGSPQLVVPVPGNLNSFLAFMGTCMQNVQT